MRVTYRDIDEQAIKDSIKYIRHQKSTLTKYKLLCIDLVICIVALVVIIWMNGLL